MGANIPLPALDIRPVQQPNPMEQVGQLLSLRSLMNQQQLQSGQVQLQQQQIRDQQALTTAFKNWDPKSQSYDDLAKSVTNAGGSGNAALQIQQHALQVRETASKIAQQDAQTGQTTLDTVIKRHDQILGALDAAKSVPDEQLGQHLTDTVAQLQRDGIISDPAVAQKAQALAQLPPVQARQQLDMFEKTMIGQKQAFENAKTQQETATSKAQQAQAEAATGKTQAEMQFYKNTGLAPGVTPDMAAYASYLQKGGKPEGWTAFKAQQEAAATQPFKIQTAQAEAQTRMAMEGMAKPVYAWNPQTNQKDLMNQTEAIAQGRKVMTPVTAKEVSDDTMLINRLSDVHQKISEYELALQKPISAKDQGNMAALLGTDKMKVGLHPGGELLGSVGIEIPLDRLDAALNKENLSGLSANARDQLVAYRNAREAMTGYTRVLSGSGRSSDKNLELQEQALPNPSISDPDFSKRSLDAFKQNLRVVGQGLPNIPGIKTPQQWEQETAQPSQPSAAPGPRSLNFAPNYGGFNSPQGFASPSLASLLSGR